MPPISDESRDSSNAKYNTKSKARSQHESASVNGESTPDRPSSKRKRKSTSAVDQRPDIKDRVHGSSGAMKMLNRDGGTEYVLCTGEELKINGMSISCQIWPPVDRLRLHLSRL